MQSGDTLLTIAEQFYGDATQWRKIYDANKDVIGADPDKLKRFRPFVNSDETGPLLQRKAG